MEVRFWGTRGSIAKPGADTVRYGGNTACVEVRSDSGALVVLDCGTGAQGLGLALVAEGKRRGHLLISHTHWDHIQGLPFFKPLFVPGQEWDIYGPRGLGTSLLEALAGQMQHAYFPVTLEGLPAEMRFHDLVEGSFQIGDILVTARYMNHPSLTLGYRLEVDGATLVYATDHEPHSREQAYGLESEMGREARLHREFLASADLLIHDAQYTAAEYGQREGWGHSTVEFAVDAALAAGVRRLALFHHDPLRKDGELDALVELASERARARGVDLKVQAAAEGLALRVAGDPAARAEQAIAAAGTDAELAPGNWARTTLLGPIEPGMARVVAEALRAEGLRKLEARDGAELLRLAEKERPALVIMGYDPARREALELARALHERPPPQLGPPVVLVVRQAGHVDRAEGEAAGVVDWLVAPFSDAFVRTHVQRWLMRANCRWSCAPLPADEDARLRALDELKLLDTPPEERFDRYTRIAAAVFDVPIALVSLVDAERQWFKARHGLSATETPRDTAFCAHAILGTDVMQVPDALADERFADNPLVTGPPHVRFYAGVPLRIAGGQHAGTLCLIDHCARRFDERQLGLLRDLGQLVERELAS